MSQRATAGGSCDASSSPCSALAASTASRLRHRSTGAAAGEPPGHHRQSARDLMKSQIPSHATTRCQALDAAGRHRADSTHGGEFVRRERLWNERRPGQFPEGGVAGKPRHEQHRQRWLEQRMRRARSGPLISGMTTSVTSRSISCPVAMANAAPVSAYPIPVSGLSRMRRVRRLTFAWSSTSSTSRSAVEPRGASGDAFRSAVVSGRRIVNVRSRLAGRSQTISPPVCLTMP